MEGNLSKRQSFSNVRMTWYGTGTGADACTGRNHGDGDWLIAISTAWGQGQCGKKVKITAKGKSTVVTVVDLCATCDREQIDLTKGVFQFFGSLDEGIINGKWEFVDGNGGGDDNNDKDEDKPDPPKKEDKPKPKPEEKKKEDDKPKQEDKPKEQEKPKDEPKKEEEEKKTTEQPKPSSTPKPSSSTPASSAASSTPSAHLATSAPVSVPPKPSTTTTVDGGVANAGGGASGLSGGIGSGSDNGAQSATINKAVVGVSALILLAVQAL
jgi:hypothetical protein